MNWEEEVRRTEENYASALADLHRFERKMAIIFMTCSVLMLAAMIGLLVIRVLQ